MSERSNAGDVLLALFIGVAVGAAVGVLLAPRSGRDTRKRLGRWVEDLEDNAGDLFDKGRDIVQETAENLKDGIDRTLKNH